MSLRAVIHSRTVLVIGIAVSVVVPALTLPRLPHVTWLPVLLGLVPWVVGKYLLCPLRWRTLTEAGLSRAWHLRAYAESELLGLLTPGHVGADLWRVRRLTRTGLGQGDAVMSVGLDRFVGAIGLAVFAVFAGTALPVGMLLVALGVGLLVVAASLLVRRYRPGLLPNRPLPPPRQLAHALVLSAAYQLTIAGLLLGTVEATGHSVSPLAALGAFGASQLAGLVPGPNGASPREGALVVALVALGVPWDRGRRGRRAEGRAGLAPRPPPGRGEPRPDEPGPGWHDGQRLMTTLAIAHRAGNSLARLHAANALGVDIIECDVHEHRGRLEVRHLKTAGPLPFLWDRWELASASAPRLGLAELLEADRHGTTFMLDVKSRRASTARKVARLLHERGHKRPVLVCGRWWPAVDILAELPFVRPVLSARSGLELARLRQRLSTAAPAHRVSVHGVSVHLSLLDADVVAELHDRVEVVMTWPVNDLQALDAVLDIGVTGVISDEPHVLTELKVRQLGG